MLFNFIDKKLLDIQYFDFLAILLNYSEILHSRKSILRKLDTEPFKVLFYKKLLRSKQTSLSYAQFHSCSNHKTMTPLKLKRFNCTRR